MIILGILGVLSFIFVIIKAKQYTPHRYNWVIDKDVTEPQLSEQNPH